MDVGGELRGRGQWLYGVHDTQGVQHKFDPSKPKKKKWKNGRRARFEWTGHRRTVAPNLQSAQLTSPYRIMEGTQAKRVFVGNLAYSTRTPSLIEHMSQAGKILRADVLMTYSGRSKGCGIVEYETLEVRALPVPSPLLTSSSKPKMLSQR